MLNNFKAVFSGPMDVYGRAFPKKDKPGKVGYECVKEPLTDERLLEHLQGKALLGQYQLHQDNTVRWFAVDFDMSKAEGELALDQKDTVFTTALKQLQRFEEAGLFCYIEVSRSGNGAHVWGFLDEPVPAYLVRLALKPLLVEEDGYDRLYPVQVQVTPAKPYGNLLALPFFGAQGKVQNPKLGAGVEGGASTFLDPESMEPIAPEVFLEGLRANPRAVIENLAAKAPREMLTSYTPTLSVPLGEVNPIGRPERLQRGFLKVVSDYGCQFMANAFKNRKTLPEPQWYAALQQLTCLQNGRTAAHLLSQAYPGYSEQETNDKFDHALQNPPVGCSYLQEHFASVACKGCTCGAPYRKADDSILGLMKGSEEPLRRSDFKASLLRMRKRRAGEEPEGVLWNLAGLDPFTRLRPKELTVIGAMPSIGKTAFVVDAVFSLASRGIPAFFFSAETGQEGLEDRLLARASGVDSKAIRGERFRGSQPFPMTDDEERAVVLGAEKLARLPIYVNYTVANPDAILEAIEEAVLSNKVSLDSPFVVFMDYLQFAASGTDDFSELSKACMEFKGLAKILRQPVVLLSQLKRETEGDDEPKINWFKGTGRIENDLDVGMILTGQRSPGAISKRKLSIVKQREGDAGIHIPLKFYQAICMFEAEEYTPIANGADLFANEPDAYDAAD